MSDRERIEEDAVEFAHGYLVGWDECNKRWEESLRSLFGEVELKGRRESRHDT